MQSELVVEVLVPFEEDSKLIPFEMIQSWWAEVQNTETSLTVDQMLYFQKVFHSSATGEQLFKLFGKDGIVKIPILFCELSRCESLNAIRKMFDKFLMFQNSKKKADEHFAPYNFDISEDDRHIVEYIGGYILHKLKRKAKTDETSAFLESLCCEGSSFRGNPLSLCQILNDVAIGSLTVPQVCLTNVLIYVETMFRKYKQTENLMKNIMESLDMTHIFSMLPGATENQYCIIALCKLYVKIRCFQKAKTNRAQHKINNNQTASLRKCLQR